jgi:alcohol dehydrogenase, propanol-preferring
MKAAVVTDVTQPMELEDRPVPEPGRGQVLVRMEACGLCHTDIHAALGDWPVKPTPPFVRATRASASSNEPARSSLLAGDEG